MFNRIVDDEAIESEEPMVVEGLGFIDDEIVFQREKIVKRATYNLFGKEVNGFEIHHGVSQNYPLSYEKGHIKGTFVHGLFNDKTFERYKRETIDAFVEQMRSKLDVERIMCSVS